MPKAAARDLRVVRVWRERVIRRPAVNRDRGKRQGGDKRRRDYPSPALASPGERQHVDGRDEHALRAHRDEEQRDDRLPRGWTDQRKCDEAGERHGLHARRGVQHERQIDREEETGKEGGAIVGAPDECGNDDKRRRGAQHLRRQPNIDAEPGGAGEQQRPQQRRVTFDVLAGAIPCAESVSVG